MRHSELKFKYLKQGLIGLLAIISLHSFAQQSPETGRGKISLSDTVVKKQNKILSDFHLKTKTDSLSNSIIGHADSLKKITNSIAHIADNKNLDFSKFNRGLDLQKGKVSHKIDSLTKVGIPHPQYTRALDSLNKLNPAQEFKKIQSKINSEQSEISSKINQPLKEVNAKITHLSKEAQVQGGTLPGISSPKVNSSISTKLPSSNLNTGSVPNDPVSQEVNTLQKDVSKDLNLNSSIQKEERNIMPSGEMKEIQQVSKEVNKDISSYSADAKNIAKGNIREVKNLDKDIVAQLPNSEMGAVQKELQSGNQQLAQLKSLKNQEEFKRQTLARGRKMATEQLAAQGKQIQPLIGKINQYQKKSDNLIRQAKGLPKQRPPREDVPPLIERFIPGLVWQIQKSNLWLIDVNPSIRFRAKKLISIGSGWVERIVIDQNGKHRPQDRVYGVRNFAEITVRKGFSARFDVERVNAFVPTTFQHQDVGERKWVWSYFAGIKKDFSFGRGVMGNVQFMYVIFDPKNQSPYLTKLNARFGFEFPLKVKRKRM
jgi:hypothetical protein